MSGNAKDRGGETIKVNLPRTWLGILFDHQPMPPGGGIYMPGAVGHEFGGGQPNRMSVIYESGVLNGFIIVLDHLGFALVMNNPPINTTGTLLEHCTYRPGEIVINSKLRQDILRVFWEHRVMRGALRLVDRTNLRNLVLPAGRKPWATTNTKESTWPVKSPS